MVEIYPRAKVLILFAHPALQKSRVNRRLISGAEEIEGVTVHDLYELYPDFGIDVREEQVLLAANDIIIFHHPLFWYSTPAILKEWQDLVLEHGWAYGHEGTALRGKKLLSVISTGGREVAYRKDGHNRFALRELLTPIEQTAYLCGMEYLPPFVVHGTLQITETQIARHAEDYRRVLRALCEGTLDYEAARSYARLNIDLDAIIREGED